MDGRTEKREPKSSLFSRVMDEHAFATPLLRDQKNSALLNDVEIALQVADLFAAPVEGD